MSVKFARLYFPAVALVWIVGELLAWGGQSC